MANILVICGPTASGKTSLALQVAEKLKTPVNILSADSRQIFKGLDIVTGKDIPTNLSSNIRIYGLDLVSPEENFNVSDYVNFARKIMTESVKNQTPLIIVGGTGLYLKAATSDYLNVNVAPDPLLREKLEKLNLEELQKSLLNVSPQRYHSLNESDIKNPRRLIRAIEITLGVPNFSYPTLPEGLKFFWVGLKTDMESQRDFIRQRVIERIRGGAIDEVRKLLDKFTDRAHPVHSSLGVADIIVLLDGKISEEELIERWVKAEVDYARRQMVWFKKQPGIIWYDKSKINLKLVDELVSILKNDKKETHHL